MLIFLNYLCKSMCSESDILFNISILKIMHHFSLNFKQLSTNKNHLIPYELSLFLLFPYYNPFLNGFFTRFPVDCVFFCMEVEKHTLRPCVILRPLTFNMLSIGLQWTRSTDTCLTFVTSVV